MKLGRFGEGRYAIVRDGHVYDASAVVGLVLAERELPRRGDPAIAHLQTIVERLAVADLGTPLGSIDEIAFLAPVDLPTKIVAAPVNYQAHVAESVADTGINYNHAVAAIDKAGLFLKASTALVGPGEGVALRFPERRTDHEIELGLVIGRTCAGVSQAEALDYVAGYAIALDMSVRGTEDRSFRKSIDGYAVLGPWLVTSDELPDPGDVEFSLRVNGELRQQSNTRHLIVGVPQLIAWASRWYTLYPGDVIMTGTPSGVGPVAPGDVLECEMQRIGTMRVELRAA